ncbi:MAG TPA: hypothetical protein VGL56_08670 [Fimbriimonadaceae bacterium]
MGPIIQVFGTTDLPNKTPIKTEVPFDGDVLETTFDVNNGWSEVANGKWQTNLDAPVAPEFYRAHHMVSAWGELDRGQGVVDQSISDGEDEGSFQTQKDFVIEARPDFLPKSAASRLPQASLYPADNPGRAVAEVIGDWKRHDWQDMAKWTHVFDDPALGKGTPPKGEHYHDIPAADRVKLCKSAFRSWEVRSARIGKGDMDADPEFPILNAKVTVHLKTILNNKEKDVDMHWVAFSPNSNSNWGVAPESVRPK